ncbi:hypothetical protein BD626DRAFT_482888 [Schizophyllum amplum]|uniref:GmrSD restriction endonucleases N-terminal domain-containing protein n=1 Tax=Schizophyllum amplum TaxID=97359 RepID=A0A550CP41_9AGAR|nr:hypothetical protein BD626DRAFT_482888 [Auriculariopsis ampla]
MNARDIVLDPPYQRGVVWSDAMQMQYLDAFFRGIYAPPIVLAAYKDGDEVKMRCIDGKQRLSSLRRFMDGLIYVKNAQTGDEYWYKDIGGPSADGSAKKLIPEKSRESFNKKLVVGIEYENISDADEREIFKYTHIGMPLASYTHTLDRYL